MDAARFPRAVRQFQNVLLAGVVTAVVALLSGCPVVPPGGDSNEPNDTAYHNTTDPKNDGAKYIGTPACSACHAELYASYRLHGHHWALVAPQGGRVSTPTEATRAGVPQPPAGFAWNDVSYLIGGYIKGALFVDQDGYVLTDGVTGTHTQWHLRYPPNGATPGFGPYDVDRTTPLSYEYSCFRCHTVNPAGLSATKPRTQDGRPGIRGTWFEAGVGCEACHGPGSNHAPHPAAREIYVDNSSDACRKCHSADADDPLRIVVSDGYLSSNGQWSELRASGGHGRFACLVCHDPHASTTYGDGRRNACTTCHTDANFAFHSGVTFVRGDYTEKVGCESCHMPRAGRSASAAGADVIGDSGARMGDVRTHIFRIDPSLTDYTAMFDTAQTSVVRDAQGRAALSTDWVCLRCHNGVGNAFLLTPEGARAIAEGIHTNAAAE